MTRLYTPIIFLVSCRVAMSFINIYKPYLPCSIYSSQRTVLFSSINRYWTEQGDKYHTPPSIITIRPLQKITKVKHYNTLKVILVHFLLISVESHYNLGHFKPILHGLLKDKTSSFSLLIFPDVFLISCFKMAKLSDWNHKCNFLVSMYSANKPCALGFKT